jgi:hypothetical protein
VYTIRARSSEVSRKSNVMESIIQDGGPTMELGFSKLTWHYDAEEPQVTAEAVEIYKSQLAAILVHEEKAAWWHGMTTEEQNEHITKMVTEAARGVGVGQQIMRLRSQKNIRAIVERGQASEAVILSQSSEDPLEKSKRLLWFMEINQLPSYEHLSSETSEVMQAVDYCTSTLPHNLHPLTLRVNMRIYPDVKKTDFLVPNPALIRFPIWALHLLPPAMHHTLVCLGLNHYIHSLPSGSNRAFIAGIRSKIYTYRGLAIHALCENIARETTRSSDLTICSILMFISMEV